MKRLRYTSAMLAIGATLTVCGGAQGQQPRLVPVGGFVVRVAMDRSTGEERSIVLLSPTPARRDTAGELLWGCATNGTLVFGIRRPQTASSNRTQDMIWTFDVDTPDTAGIRPFPAGWLWSPATEESAAFTQRARTAARLMIRLPAAAAGQDAVYEYDLAGADSALDRLKCVRNRRLVREAADTLPTPAATADEQTLTWAEVTELPRPTNTSAFSRALSAGYPRSLREARVTGTVGVRFRVLEDGSVDPASVTITSTDNEQFNEPTIRAIHVLRFRPARVGDRPVKVWIEMPIAWVPPA